MVTVAIVLAVTVYAFASGFAQSSDGPTNAAVPAEAVDRTEDGNARWLKVTLAHASQAPFAGESISATMADPTGSTTSAVCETPKVDRDGGPCLDPLEAGDTWAPGQRLWVPCQAGGGHHLTVTVVETVVLDAERSCDAVATGTSGTAWTATGSATGKDLRDVTDTSSMMLAVGDGGTVLARDGGSWSVNDADGPSGNGNNLRGLDATDDGDRAWVVGASGDVGVYDDTGSLLANHSGPDGQTGQFNDVAASGSAGSATIHIVDSSGNVIRSTDAGGNWSTVDQVDSAARAISMVDATTGFIVNDDGSVFETTDGATFTEIGIAAATMSLEDVHATASDDAWVVSDETNAYHWDGSSWNTHTLSSGNPALYAVQVDGGDGQIVGEDGAIYDWDGSQWDRVASPTTESLLGTTLASPDAGVGSSGTVVESN
jgi:photosystem II stability/assembly factor-like uncharacterized protein